MELDEDENNNYEKLGHERMAYEIIGEYFEKAKNSPIPASPSAKLFNVKELNQIAEAINNAGFTYGSVKLIQYLIKNQHINDINYLATQLNPKKIAVNSSNMIKYLEILNVQIHKTGRKIEKTAEILKKCGNAMAAVTETTRFSLYQTTRRDLSLTLSKIRIEWEQKLNPQANTKRCTIS